MFKKEKIGFVVIVVIVLTALVGMLMQAPIAQDVSYHLFTDTRAIGSIPNAWNVVSNTPFLLVGILGLYRLTVPGRLKILGEIKIAYGLLFLGAAAVALGSGYYHLWPDNRTLVWDRLPMTIAFMSLLVIIISEFISIHIGRALLVPLLLTGIVSVVYWYTSEVRGEGDLRLYALVQFTPMLLIPVILICFRSCYTRVSGYWWLLLAYVVSKVFEHFDVEIYHALGVISGHSLKHVAAALGLYLLLVSYERRSYS